MKIDVEMLEQGKAVILCRLLFSFCTFTSAFS